jgi:hypothetical protein
MKHEDWIHSDAVFKALGFKGRDRNRGLTVVIGSTKHGSTQAAKT